MENLELDLDPKKVIDSLNEMREETLKLADTMEDALGKQAGKSIEDLVDKTEKGTNKISKFFNNLGHRVKEDLKTAFDVGKLLSGIKLSEAVAQGTRQIFDMERAFDRLNTRLQLTGKSLQDFKKNLGTRVAAAGQKLEDIIPGVDVAASKGGVKSPEQLSAIGESLAQARATTGESTEGLADTITEILKTQGKQVTAKSFKDTLDALQGTRVQGAFGSAQEAGQAIEGLSPFAKKMGLGTRELGGLAAAASRSGSSGQNILQQLMEQGTQVGGQERLNAVFGTQLFKKGKLDASAFQNIDKNRFGQYSQQTLSEATGLQGANGGDLSRFLDSMKDGMGDFKKVTQGANETASQFQSATDNLASKIDKFKERAKESGREIGESFALMGKDLLGGHFGAAAGDLKGVAKAGMENKGTLLAMLGLTGAGAVLAGSGAKGLLKKVPGLGGLAGGLAGGELAKSAGVTPVYVVNASEIGGGGGLADLAGGLKGAGGKIGKFGGALGALGMASLPLAGAAAVGGGIGYGINKIPGVSDFLSNHLGGSMWDSMFDAITKIGGGQGIVSDKEAMDMAEMARAVEKGTHEGMAKAKTSAKPTYTNPSSVGNTGAGM